MVQVTPSTDIAHWMLPLGSANETGSVDVADELEDGPADADNAGVCPAEPSSPLPPLFRNTSSSTTASTTSTTSTMTKSRRLRAEVIPLRSSPRGHRPARWSGALGDQDHTGRTGRANRPGQAIRTTDRPCGCA